MTERPDRPDIDFVARVTAEELRFSEAPESGVEFFGHPERDSASGSERLNLPDSVEDDVTYHCIRVDYRIRSKIVGAGAPPSRRRRRR
ncbi:hypothetical protein SAMN02982929_02671 [Saccharopolyspora kobensis]|uniref:Uncharacterized protein n=1 Tax=Saccharopolyspora kobensis TaxID=146035 RepID=A0A1H6BKZ5_9PSEU|nr:hypothetical protein [Saccharopolyspora kobensis]SEG61378.1 hypothetical protein SAMN02982929_02671 [Saccharopolyspora kobensis]SFE86765.1 hypothetical protein SAMN05216506_11594 [Saccharopolyspora kobensis]